MPGACYALFPVRLSKHDGLLNQVERVKTRMLIPAIEGAFVDKVSPALKKQNVFRRYESILPVFNTFSRRSQ